MNSNVKSNIIKERKSAPVSPRFVDDVIRAPSLNPNHESNVSHRRIASASSARKLNLATTESYPNTPNNAKPESVSSPDATKLKSVVDEFPSSNPELSIDPVTLKSLVDQLSIYPKNPN